MPNLWILGGMDLFSAWMGDRLRIPVAVIFLEICTNYIIILKQKESMPNLWILAAMDLFSVWMGDRLGKRGALILLEIHY